MALLGKWLDGVDHNTPVTDVVELAVRGRVASVLSFLPLAADHYEDDPEYVHQLRVSSRRGVAALDLFQVVLPKKPRRQLRAWLRDVRQSAGNARDIDVMALQLGQYESVLTRSQIEQASQFLARYRQQVQPELEQVAHGTSPQQVTSMIDRLVQRCRERGTPEWPNWGSLARNRLRQHTDAFLAAATVPEVTPPTATIPGLHQLRIRSKRLRYAMELCVGAIGKKLRTGPYRFVEDTQKHLGRINDCANNEWQFLLWSNEIKTAQQAGAFRLLAECERQDLLAAFHEFSNRWDTERLAEFGQQCERALANS